MAGSSPSSPRRSGRSATSSTAWPATDRRRPPRSPSRTSTCCPYDPAGYGLGDAPAGPYEPAERVWSPVRDPRPARPRLAQRVRAGGPGGRRRRLPARAARRRLAGDAAPDRAGPADARPRRRSTTCGRASGAAPATTSPAAGACGCRCRPTRRCPEMAELAGCHLADRVPADRPGRAPLRPVVGAVRGRRRARAAGRRRDARDALGAARGRRRARSSRSTPTAARRWSSPGAGSGVVATCAAPVELLLAGSAGPPRARRPEPGPVRRPHRARRHPRDRPASITRT